MRGFVASFIAISLSFMAACGASRSFGPTAEDLAKALCDLAHECCNEGEIDFLLGPYSSERDCAERLVSSTVVDEQAVLNVSALLGASVTIPNLAVLTRALRERRIGINHRAVRACIEFIRARGCNGPAEVVPPVEYCDVVDAEENPCDIESIIEGKVGHSGYCEAPLGSLECEEDLVCIRVESGLFDLGDFGTCVEAHDVNELCYEDEDCLPDLYCSQLDGTCQVPGEVAEACQYSEPAIPVASLLLLECDPDLTCSPFDSLCAARCARGHTCTLPEHCEPELGCIASAPVPGFILPQFCDTPRTAGQPCYGLDDCGPGLGCNVPGDPPTCGPLAANGQPCILGAQCSSGYCDVTFVSCAAGPCPNGRTCNVGLFCDPACAPAPPPPAAPLADGSLCLTNDQCQSEFCNLAAMPAVCATLPLANNTPCLSSIHCASRVCFNGTCQTGAAAGLGCDPFSVSILPCDPFSNFCDTDAEPPVCATFVEAGGTCDRALECRSGTCQTIWGRRMCSTAARPNEFICGGAAI